MTTLSPPLARRRAARWLRAMRLGARLSLQEAAPRLDMTTSSLHRLETGVTLADVHVARSMMDLYDTPMPDLLDVIRAARRRGWWRGYQVADREYIGWEAGAASVYEVATLRIPDLLRTEDYTRHLLRGSRDRPVSRPSDEIRARRIRQARLTDPDDRLAYTAVLDESVLRDPGGNPDVMRAQLGHIVEAAAGPTVTVLVLPASAGARIRCGGFRLLDFDHSDDPPVLYADVIDSARREDRADLIESTRRLFDVVVSSSLSPEASTDFIQDMAQELNPQIEDRKDNGAKRR